MSFPCMFPKHRLEQTQEVPSHMLPVSRVQSGQDTSCRWLHNSESKSNNINQHGAKLFTTYHQILVCRVPISSLLLWQSIISRQHTLANVPSPHIENGHRNKDRRTFHSNTQEKAYRHSGVIPSGRLGSYVSCLVDPIETSSRLRRHRSKGNPEEMPP